MHTSKLSIVISALLLFCPQPLSAQEAGKKITVLANSIDYSISGSYLDVFELTGLQTERVTADEFQQHQTDPIIFILGGHNAPEGVGGIVGAVLNKQEKATLTASPDARRVIVVPNLWAEGQVVFIFAGYGKEQTREMVGAALGDVIRGLTFKDPGVLGDYGAEERAPTPPIDPMQAYTDVDARQANAITQNLEEVVVVDVRSKSFYDAGHIPGAVSMPQRQVEDMLKSFDKDKTYLLYCGGNSESIYVGGVMDANGFNKVYRLVDGYVAWRKAGYPREK